jgi:hypothetical protein
MPRGISFTKEQRVMLFDLSINQQKKAHEIWLLAFMGDERLCSLNSLNVILSRLRNMSESDKLQFLAGPVSRKFGGRTRTYTGELAANLVRLRLDYPLLTLDAILKLFTDIYGIPAPSKSTLSKLLKRIKIS